MKYLPIEKFSYLKIETDILNLKYGPYQIVGNQNKVETTTRMGKLVKTRSNGKTGYFVEKDFITNNDFTTVLN